MILRFLRLTTLHWARQSGVYNRLIVESQAGAPWSPSQGAGSSRRYDASQGSPVISVHDWWVSGLWTGCQPQHQPCVL